MPVTEVTAPVTPLLSGMLSGEVLFAVEGALIEYDDGIPILGRYSTDICMSQCPRQLRYSTSLVCYLMAHDSCSAARVNQGNQRH